ncbi:MAG TPA: hypothetical protein VFU47_00975, partial [Armatimonadota bacterium]|nr:hypothetical protein [Armatimonadota bacterium]
ERVRRSGGRVYPGGPEVTLLVDVKADAEPSYRALRELLAGYRDMLTTYRPGRVERRAVAVILSGERARTLMEADPDRCVAMDGRLEDLRSRAPVDLVPWISASWEQEFRWRGDGPLPAEEREKLARLVRETHAQGRKLRFWATPDRPEAWQELLSAGVDLLNTDRLEALRDFLLTHPNETPRP